MNLLLKLSNVKSKSAVKISGSKSETNRLLLLQALFPNLILENASNSDDSEVMRNALLSDAETADIHHAGTTMRFLTAYFAIQEGKKVRLTGSARMKERPITILVDALRQLGAEITYEENEGFPPLLITGKKLTKNKIALPADVSSQYISALLLIAPKLEQGIELTLEGNITSVPYIKMTLSLLNGIGIQTSFEDNVISVKPQAVVRNSQLVIESDWSSASYFYSLVALSPIGTQIMLSNYKKDSFQGDSIVSEIYKSFGVATLFEGNSIQLIKKEKHSPNLFSLNLNGAPDIAQTIAVTCFGLEIACCLTGLHTLKIKETDRLLALKNELEKLGGNVEVTNDSLMLDSASVINSDIKIKTYQDHRMAMAFAPLSLKVSIIIEEAEVVSKSYPDFWKDLESIGIQIAEQH